MEHVTSPDGTRIGFAVTGAGPPLVLVHGTTATHGRWAGVAPALERQFTLIAIDRRGRGGSGDGAAYSIAREAEDIAAVVESLDEPACLVGHSYGAVCSLEAALLTSRLRRLVLYEPPLPVGVPLYREGLPARLQALVDRGSHEEALLLFFREVVRVPEADLAVMRELPVWQARVALAPTIPRELRIDEHYVFEPGRFADMTTPTLVLAGSESAPPFHVAVHAVRDALQNVRFVTLAGEGHVAMDTAPELFTRELLSFL